MKNTTKTFITSLLLIIALFICALPVRAGSLSDAESKKKELEGSLNEAKALVNSLTSSVDDVESNIQALDNEINAIERETKSINEESAEVAARLAATEASIAALEEKLESHKRNMELRIVYSYENGRTNMINSIFSSRDFSGLMNAVQYCIEIQEFDNRVLSEFEESLKELNIAKVSMENDRARIAELAEKNEQQVKALDIVRVAREEELAKLDGELTDAKSVAAAYEAEVKAQNEVLAKIRAAIEAEKAAAKAAAEKAAAEAAAKAAEEKAAAEKAAAEKAAAEAAAKAEAEKNNQSQEDQKQDSQSRDDQSQDSQSNPSADKSSDDKNDEKETTDIKVTGSDKSFIWPCPSSKRITSEYGPRTSPTAGASSDHKGVDVGAPAGSDIIAADGGKVITSTYSSSAGNYIIISHGLDSNGQLICSVYMHCSKLIAEEGDIVSRGQKIAEVGSTGISTGNHLHFGVTVDGSYVSPWAFLAKP